jgi:hypothetical protein
MLSAFLARGACLSSGETLTGTLAAGETNAYCFNATNGEIVTISMGVFHHEWGAINILGPDGESVAALTNYWIVSIDNLRVTNSGEFTVLCTSETPFDFTLTVILRGAENDGLIQSGETKSGTLLHGDVDAHYFFAESNAIASILIGVSSYGRVAQIALS